MLRIGQGYDIHRLVTWRPLRLGGITIATREELGCAGHSDADVLLHAITDAVLGSLALGDIGQWFPDSDERYRDIDSRQLLKQVLSSPQLADWHLVNLDCTVITQKPKLAPHIPAMREQIAAIFGVPVSLISVKAKTNEELDAVGRGEAVAAHAVVLGEIP